MSRRVQGLLGFWVEDQCYQFGALLFGLSIAPQIFTKVMSTVIHQLRKSGVNIIQYLDNLLLWNSSPELLLQDIDTSIQLLTHLGWCINERKSNLLPSREFLYLGLQWNTVQRTVIVSQDNVMQYTTLACKVLRLSRVKLA